MMVRWIPGLAAALAVIVAAGPARGDDDFEERYREQQKKYEERRREEFKKFEERRREDLKRQSEWQRKREEQYREDLKRQDEWRKKADKEARKRLEEQLKRQMGDGGRPTFAYPPPPPYGAAQDQNWLPFARRAAAAFAPELARALAGIGAQGREFDPRAAQVAADLARRSERLAELSRRDADLGALRREYAGFDAGWQQLSPYLDRAARDPGARELAWRLYQAERQLRAGIGYDGRAAGPNWASAHGVARDQSVRLGQLVAAARRDGRFDINLVYDLRNAQREAQAFEELVARRARAEELRQQHDYLAATLARVIGQLQAAGLDGPVMQLVQQVMVADRQLCGELGLPAYVDVSTDRVVERAAELKVAADRLRRDMWAVLGSADQDVVAYYVRPADELAAQTDLVHQMLTEGRPIELVLAGWQHVVQWHAAVGQRLQALDQNQFPTIHQLAGDVGRLADEVNTLLSLAARP